MHNGVAGQGVVGGEPRSPASPVLVVRRLGVKQENLLRVVIPIGNILASCVDKLWDRRSIVGFMNAAVDLVAQPVVQGEVRSSLPCVLKVEVVGFAADRSLVEPIARGRDAC